MQSSIPWRLQINEGTFMFDLFRELRLLEEMLSGDDIKNFFQAKKKKKQMAITYTNKKGQICIDVNVKINV